MAHALSRSRLGPRQGARHALQHRRRHPHGARHRRHAVRQLVGLPRGRLGPQRAGVRRPRGRRRLPEAHAIRSASWSTPTASASSTRAPTSATTPTPSTAASILRAAAASSPGRCSTARSLHLLRDEYRIKRGHQGRGRHARGARRQARRRRTRAGVPDDDRDLQRRGAAATSRSIPTSRTAAAPTGLAIDKSNWANTHRQAAVRGLSRSPAASPSPSAACKIDTDAAR